MNPFLYGYTLKLVKVNHITDVATSTTKYEKIVKSYFVEAQSKTSVYYIPYAEDFLFKKLTRNGRDIFYYIIYNLPKDADSIKLKLDKLVDETNISRPTIYRGIKELSECGVITKKNNSEYWINPYYMFNGDRVKFIRSIDENLIEQVSIVNLKN